MGKPRAIASTAAPPPVKKPRAPRKPRVASTASPTPTTVTANPIPANDVAKITQARALIAQILAIINGLLRGTLSAKESRALLRARLAGQTLLPDLVGLVGTKPALAPIGNDAQTIQAKYQLLQAFMIFAQELSGMENNVQSTLRQMQVEMYKLGLDIYAIASRSASSDPQVEGVVNQVKTALAHGPRSPKKSVTTLAPPTTLRITDPAAAAAAQAAAEATAGTAAVTVSGKKKKGTAAAPASPASSTSTGNTGGDGSSNPATPASPTVPQVPVYTPGGQAGTAPATNAGTTAGGTPHA